jgi:ActR/RegA family two-component response regulator
MEDAVQIAEGEELEAVQTALASAQAQLLAAEDETIRIRAEVERLRQQGERKAALAAAPPRLAIVDTDDAWETAARTRPVLVLPPALDLAPRLAELAVTDLLVNLVSPGALDALSALRAAGSVLSPHGCLAAPGGSEILFLGRVEVLSAPLDPEHVVGLIDQPGRRVLMAGDDAERMITLRQRLTRAGMSVSIAWDAKQAEGLLGMLVPQVAVVDLGLPRGGHALVARLGGLKQAPLVVLVRRAGDDASAFAAALTDQLRSRRGVARAPVLDDLLRLRPAVEAVERASIK